MQFQMIAAVALGGALGAVSRYLAVGQIAHWLDHGFPYGTLTVNIVGSFLMGVIVETSALVWSPSPELRAFLAVGFLGALTTFSTFSLETVLLYERGTLLLCAVYVLASVVLSVGAFFAAIILLRAVLT